jgi:crossover junction endodeoxyribonuclease RuvC
MAEPGRLILGIDPGLASMGWGIVREEGSALRYVAHGCIRTPSSETSGSRLQLIARALENIIEIYGPSEAGIESLYFAKNATSAMPVAEAMGVALLTLFDAGLKVVEYSPGIIKQRIVGSARAEKAQVQELVRILLGLPSAPEPDHASDALAAAICHAHSRVLA